MVGIWPSGPGEMATRMRAQDWSAFPLGPPENWPPTLRITVDTVLNHAFPMCVFWGRDAIAIYNDAYCPLLGIKHPAMLARPLFDVWPETRALNAPILRRVWEGETVSLREANFPNARSGVLEDGWFDVVFSPLRDEQGHVAGALLTTFDATERVVAKRAHDAAIDKLTSSEERQMFLLKLSDALRALNDPDEIRSTAMTIMGMHLNVNRAAYADLADPDAGDRMTVVASYANGVAPWTGEISLADFGADLGQSFMAGRTVVIDDVETDPRFGDVRAAYGALDVRAAVGVPIVRGGRTIAVTGVQSAAARRWTREEITLIEDVADRIWDAVERARAETALQNSEARFRQFALASSDALWIRETKRLDLEYASHAFAAIFGVPADSLGKDLRAWAALIVPEDRDGALDVLEALRQGNSVVHEFRIQRPSDQAFRWIRNTAFPLQGERERIQRIAGIFSDITETKRRRFPTPSALFRACRNRPNCATSRRQWRGSSAPDSLFKAGTFCLTRHSVKRT